ncbi:MAG: heparinase II/III family protein [Acidiferrobacteraceae bacterium]
MTTLAWKFARLRAMGVEEIAWRARQWLCVGLERFGQGDAQDPPVPQGRPGAPWLPELPQGLETERYRTAGDCILSGRFDVFALKDAHLGFPPDWNRDPQTGIRAPMSFGKTLNYRDERLVGNIKYLWEPNRHLELVTLAQAYHLTGEMRYAEGARRLVESWIAQCPYPFGPNWASALEQALRLTNWAFSWHLLGGEQSALFSTVAGSRFKQRWLDAVYRHQHFIAGYRSQYSSANNHLLGELMGLFIGAVTWPLWSESGAWREQAQRALEAEVLRQNTTDGVNREQATWYQYEVADMMLLAGLTGRANGHDFSDAYWKRLEALLEFLASIMDVSGHVPLFGDADDALIGAFSPEPGFKVFHSLLATGAVLFNRSDFAAKGSLFDDKSRWLLGDDAAGKFSELRSRPASRLPLRRAYPEGGVYILGDAFETEEEIRIVADAAPLGYLSIAAHGHADALSFTLSVSGRELLIDPGTYAYHTKRLWRDYFRGTSAHNTLRVDRLDQSVPGGSFLWLRHAHATCQTFESTPDRDRLVGRHDGYLRLPDGVEHWRELTFIKADRHIEVVDRLVGRGRHFVEVFWHFSDGCEVILEGNRLIARHGPVHLTLDGPECLEARLLLGSVDPIGGWVSRRFDVLEPATTAVWSGTVDADQVLRSVIRLTSDGNTG